MLGIKWFQTRELYLVTLQYLAGVPVPVLRREYPSTQWRVSEMDNDSSVKSIHTFSRYRCQIFLAKDLERLAALREQLYEYVQSVPHKLIWEEDTGGNISLDVSRARLLRMIKGYTCYFIPAARPYFPPVVPFSALRRVLIGESSIGILDTRRCQELQYDLPGGYLEIDPSVVRGWNCDRDVMQSLYRLEGREIRWPMDVKADWYCTVKASGHGRDLRVVLLVDGENIMPVSFLLFVKYQLKVANGTKVECVVFVSERNEYLWQFAAEQIDNFVEIKVVPRLLESKSVMDFAIYTEVSMRYFRDEQRDFVIMSSDSDFSQLYTTYNEASFSFACNRSHTSLLWLQQMKKDRIPCYLLDESTQRHNTSVFNTQYLMWRAEREPADVATSAVKWQEFLNSIQWDTASTVASRAFRILREGKQREGAIL